MRILTFKKVYLIHGKQRLERLWIFKLIKENFSPTGSREDRSWLYLSAFVLNMVPLPHQSTVFLRLGKAGWYCVTKALFFLFVYLFSSNSCLPYFFFLHQNKCSINICHNDATCLNGFIDQGFLCLRQAGYAGEYCEKGGENYEPWYTLSNKR